MAEARRRPGRPRNPIDRSQLLAIARQAFAENGYAATSLRQIAQAAGLRKASLFHHFKNKEELYLSSLTEVLAELAVMVTAARDGQASFITRLDNLGDDVVGYFGSRPEAARLLLRELVGGGPLASGPGRAAIDQNLEGVAQFLRRGIEQGAMPEQDADQLALSIIGLHLLYFAAPTFASELMGKDVFEPQQVEARRLAVRSQLRGLCGLDAS